MRGAEDTLLSSRLTQIGQKAAGAKKDLTAYRIDPEKLEPKRVSIRVILELSHAPESYKTMEMSFGKLYHYAERFPSPEQLTWELHINAAEIEIQQLGARDDWYRIRFLAVYNETDAASARARQIWIQIGVQALYKEGKIRRARYGVEEIETWYRRWLGQLDDPEEPWIEPSSREEHMAELALAETLVKALDVDGFREFIGMSKDQISDDELLVALHERRTQSKYVSSGPRAASKKWLAKDDKQQDGK